MEGAKESPGLQCDLAPDSRRLIGHALDQPRANVLKDLHNTDWMGSFVRELVTGAGIPSPRS